MSALPGKTIALGNPQSSEHQISQVLLAQWMTEYEAMAGTNGAISYIDGSLSDLKARTTTSDGEYGLVINTASEAGVYERLSGTWTQKAGIPSIFVESLAANEAKAAALEAEDRADTATIQAGVATAKASEATLAAIAAGADLVTSLTDPVPANGSIELLQTEAGTQVHEVQTGAWAQIGWLGVPVFPTIAAISAASGFVDGQYVEIRGGLNESDETFKYDAGSTASIDGTIVVEATGMGVGRWISQRTEYSSIAEFKTGVALGKVFSEGSTVVAGGTLYRFLNDANADISGLTGWQKIESASVFGGANAPNTKRHDFNYVSGDANACEAAAGTNDQPNLIGVPCEVFEFTATESQTAFECSTTLNVTDEDYLNVRVFLIDGESRAVEERLIYRFGCADFGANAL